MDAKGCNPVQGAALMVDGSLFQQNIHQDVVRQHYIGQNIAEGNLRLRRRFRSSNKRIMLILHAFSVAFASHNDGRIWALN